MHRCRCPLFSRCALYLSFGKSTTFPSEQQIRQICFLILDMVDEVASLLLDHLEQSAVNQEKLVAAAQRAQLQDENIQALNQAYAGQ